MFGSLDISASALVAQRTRLNVIAGNIANMLRATSPTCTPRWMRRVISRRFNGGWPCWPGTFSFHQAPQPDEMTEPPVDVLVTLEACPECGAAWKRSE